MYTFLIVVHVLVCFFLIAVILLQAGKGGGLSDLAGGGQMQQMLGTQSNTFLTKLTEIAAVIFIVTSLTLGILSAQKGKSLVERNKPVNAPAKVETKQASEEAAKEVLAGAVSETPKAEAAAGENAAK